MLATLRNLELVEREVHPRHASIQLTPLGRRLADIAVSDELLLAELIHLRYWSLWTAERGGKHFSWAYQVVGGLLWEGAPLVVDPDRLVAMVLAAAEQQFAVDGVSFSASSILGILHWLRALTPPCIVGGEFRRRPTCPPETVLLALEGVQLAANRSLGAPIRLTPAIRERVCRAALIDDEAFDDVLAQAEETLGLSRRRSDGPDLVLLRESVLAGLVAQGDDDE